MRVKKVTAFVACGSKKHTYGAAREFLDRLEALGGVETEIVRLSDYRIEYCRGCKTCFAKGEEFCPLKDDRDVLIGKMMDSDAVIFASPNYNFHVSGVMKSFLDRLGFFYHRPAFFGKTYTSLVVQGIGGGGKIVNYLDFAGARLGFNVVKGSFSTAFDPMTEKERAKRDRTLETHVRRFHERLSADPYPSPSLFELIGFRMGRQTTAAEGKGSPRDFAHYTERGWLKSDFWYPVRLGIFKQAVGRLADAAFGRMARKKAAGRPNPALAATRGSDT